MNPSISEIICLIVLPILSSTTVSSQKHPEPFGFPSSMVLNRTNFDTWAGDNAWNDAWTAYPLSATHVLEAANWAATNNWVLRPSGQTHTWSPITLPSVFDVVDPDSPTAAKPQPAYPTIENPNPSRPVQSGQKWRVMLMKTQGLNRMGISKSQGLFWAEPGVLLETLLTQLELQGMGLLAHSGIGEITLGGILAVGGHGAGAPAKDEIKSQGHTYGSMSNLIVSLTAIVYDRRTLKFVAKDFHRHDPETKVLLVNLGRIFITNVTMRAGPLQYLRCRSYTSITTNELFANPTTLRRGQRSFSSFLDSAGRVEAILFAFTSNPWLKVWTLTDSNGPQKPLIPFIPGVTSSRRVNTPYNYKFSDNFSPAISEQVQQIKRGQSDFLARTIGALTYKFVAASLPFFKVVDIWGESKNVFLYIKSTTLKYHSNGYAILCARGNVQRAIYEAFKTFERLIAQYERERKYPINGPLELRVTGIDDPLDVMVPGAQGPSIGASTPVEGHPDYDTVVWMNIFTYTRTQFTCHFMEELEKEFLGKFDGTWAVVRVEWSKGWAYTTDNPWTNQEMMSNKIPDGFKDWDYHKRTTDEMDSGSRGVGGVFSNQFHNFRLFGKPPPGNQNWRQSGWNSWLNYLQFNSTLNPTTNVSHL